MTIKKKQKGLDSRYSDFLSGYTRSWILIMQTVLQAPMLQPAQCFFKLMYLQSKKKNWRKFEYSGKVSSSCSTSGFRRVTHVKHKHCVISYE